mgnify:CR=1 FL=1
MNLRRVVARNLRRIRDETGVTQEELAYRSGLNHNYVGMIERCENAPSWTSSRSWPKLLT